MQELNLNLNKKLQKILTDPKHQQRFFDNCSDDEMKILMQLYKAYPDGYPLSSDNVAVGRLKTQMAIVRVGQACVPHVGACGQVRFLFSYALNPWAKDWLDKNKK